MLKEQEHFKHDQTTLAYQNYNPHSSLHPAPCLEVSTRSLSPQKQLKKELNILVSKLQQQTFTREQQVNELKQKIKEFYEYQQKHNELQRYQRKLQSEVEDLEIFEDKMKQEIRMLTKEEQITKGKSIIEYNKIVQTKQEQQNELQRKDILCKHFDDVLKGTDILKKKIKTLGDELKKKPINKVIDQQQLKLELTKLENEIQNKSHRFLKLLQKKKKMFTSEDYRQLQKKNVQLKNECSQYQKIKQINNKLLKDKIVLEERINFFKSVDTQFINEKRSLVQELTQKYFILETQRDSYAQQLKKNQEELTVLEQEFPLDLLETSRKSLKRKREPKSKNQKKVKEQKKFVEVEEVSVPNIEDRPFNRWKGKGLKKKCSIVFVIGLIVSLLLSTLFGFRF